VKRVSPRALLVAAGFALSTALGVPALLRAIVYLVRIPVAHDFAVFYLAALAGARAPASLYDPGTVNRLAAGAGIVDYDTNNYPPIVALLFRPFTLLPFGPAKLVWLGLNIVLVGALLAWAWRRLRPRGWRAGGFAVWFALLLPATAENLILGQLSPIVGALLAIAVLSAARRQRRWDVLGGSALGLAAAVKLWPILLSGYFLLRRRYALAALSLVVCAMLTAAGTLALGRAATSEYFLGKMPNAGVENANTFRAGNQSIWGVAQRLYRGGVGSYARLSESNGRDTDIAPIVRAEWLYWFTTIGFCATVAAALLWLFASIPADNLVAESHGFWAGVIAIVAVLPFSWTHYAFFLLFPLISLLADEGQPLASVYGAGVLCLLLTLVHRFYAWLPPSALLLNFVFVADAVLLYRVVRVLSDAAGRSEIATGVDKSRQRR